MFGDESSRPVIRICCGPRCGAEPAHRAIYRSVETTAAAAEFDLRPVMCQGLCGSGVTIILPDRHTIKIRDAEEARYPFKGHE